MNRHPEDDFAPISEWLRSERPPFAEEDFAAMRRGVWSEIEARREPEDAFRPGRLLFAGGVLLAAALVAVLWFRLRNESVVASVRAPVPASTPAAASAAPQLLVENLPAPPAARRRLPARRPRGAEGVPVRIEFQTANPDVRIIWLVKKGEAAPRPAPAGRIEEVS
jgi:hypothetical protein